MQKHTLIRNENRIIGGVCSSLSEKYNFPKWILRVIFVITSILMTFPVFIYLLLWLLIPNGIKTTQADKKKKKTSQNLGFFIGGFLGWFIGESLGIIAIDGDKSGGLVVFIFALIGIPVGAIIGFSIMRIISEKRTITNINQD